MTSPTDATPDASPDAGATRTAAGATQPGAPGGSAAPTAAPAGAYDGDLALALEVADALDALTSARFGALDLRVEAKPDATPVSDADTAAERIAREHLAVARPADSLLGEEYGGEVARTGRQWVIDPIDGTKNFVRGVPVWASLVALVDDGVARVGVVSAPALGRRWWAAHGSGAWRSVAGGAPQRLAVSAVADLADASVSYASLDGWRDRDLLPVFLDLLGSVWRTRAFGDFWSYVLLAEGSVDVATEPELALHDMAALVPIVQEAGGRFTSLAGVDGPFGGDALATNGLLHAEVLARLRG
ncbi:MAG TPA: histidinol phosphatase [Micrococcales bacterium]|uniref:Histidinol-phosphatase n=1 Tax=Miniimonas arenae TaxID=676201 RepID=A0A5C5BCJ8_9MICO|nr:inositol monophosphatase family protein [Miniimonas arenae]TNU75951.1 histidinol phosphatase [Miniimonas arenae]HCX84126.1 histidinol phosphatase [Micrococcales bacterium]